MVAIRRLFFNKFTNDVDKFTVEMQNTPRPGGLFIKHSGKA